MTGAIRVSKGNCGGVGDLFMLYNVGLPTGESLQCPRKRCEPWDVNNERRQTGALQAVGWPNSTDEGVKSERYKHWREVEKGLDLYSPAM